MPPISTKIGIHAPPSRVWDVLMDFEHYPEWNPFVIEISGEKQVGKRLLVRLQGPKDSVFSFTPAVVTVEPNTHFSWRGRLFNLPYLFTGTHHFALVASDNGLSTDFEQSEDFSGILVWLFHLMGGSKDTEANFRRMNEALKQKAEQDTG